MARRRIPRTSDQSTPPVPVTDDRFFAAGLLVFLVALALRLFYVWQIQRAPFASMLMGDARAYDQWAQRIAAGDWLGREVFYQAPLYPYFLAGLYTLAGHHLVVVRLSQALLGAAACLLIGLTARRLFTKQIGLIAGLCLALYAPAIFFEGLVQKSGLDLFFTSLIPWLISGLIAEPRSRARWPMLGVVLGALSLTRENALVSSPWSVAGQWGASQGNPGEAIEHFRRAVQLAPQDGATHYDLGSLLLNGGQVAEAIEEFRGALVHLPDSVEAHNNLGIALASNGHLTEAIEQFRESLALKPDFAEAQRNLAMALALRQQGGPPPGAGKK